MIGVCISEQRGTGKINIGQGYLEKDHGLVGDAHAGSEREVSILTIESIETAASKMGIVAGPGDFAENITLKGLDLQGIGKGSRLILGEAEVEVIRIGKEIDASHTFSFHGMALLVTEGCFCRVIRSGRVRIGDYVLLIS